MGGAESRVNILSVDGRYALIWGDGTPYLQAVPLADVPDKDWNRGALCWKLEVWEKHADGSPKKVTLRNDVRLQPTIDSTPELSWGPWSEQHYWVVELENSRLVTPVYFRNSKTEEYLAVANGLPQCRPTRSPEALFHLYPARGAYTPMQAAAMAAAPLILAAAVGVSAVTAAAATSLAVAGAEAVACSVPAAAACAVGTAVGAGVFAAQVKGLSELLSEQAVNDRYTFKC